MKVNKKYDLIVMKSLCKEALRLKQGNVCEITLYTREVQQLIALLEYAIENNICKQL